MSGNSKLNIERLLAALLERDNYAEAVERTLKLVAAYEEALAKRKWEEELERNFAWDWGKAVKSITGQRRLARAEKSFTRLCAHLGKGKDDLETWRKEGFQTGDMTYLSNQFTRFFGRKDSRKKVLARAKRPKKPVQEPHFRG